MNLPKIEISDDLAPESPVESFPTKPPGVAEAASPVGGHASSASSGIDSQMARLLDRWEDARARNIVLTAEQLCEDFPERLDEVRKQVAELQRFGRMFPLDQPQPVETPTERPTADSVRGAPLVVESRYHSLQFLAKGGLGIVYRAGDELLHRDVAIKFIQKDQAKNVENRMRFLVEAEVTGRLEHPGVVPVHGIGRDETGCPFYVMRLIDGQTLDAAIADYHGAQRRGRRQRLGFRQLLARFVSVCRTLDYAHNRCMLHQDIKPENIMLGKYGETLVLDWGLARPIGRDQRPKHTGERTLVPKSIGESGSTSGSGGGTPPYMSPEQAVALRAFLAVEGDAAKEAAIDVPETSVASDVYGLGATLYKLLTGSAPFAGKTHDVLKRVEAGAFAPPRAVRRDVPAPLDSICRKAMALRPHDRYDSAAKLADELEHWLADEQVEAHRETFVARSGRWFRRHRLSALVGVVALAGLLVVIGFAGLRQKGLAEKAERARLQAEQLRDKGLVQTARFAAFNLKNEIEGILRTMELEATNRKLRDELLALAQSESLDDEEQRAAGRDQSGAKLQAWIDDLNVRRRKIDARSWLITNAAGAQVARSPADDDTRWTNLAWRDYFHGRGRDLKPEQADENRPGPLRRPHVSRAFQSKSDEKGLIVMLSVPIWESPDRTDKGPPLGVLSLSIACNQFDALRTVKGSEEFALLIDARDDSIEGQAQNGLVLHHGRAAESADRVSAWKTARGSGGSDKPGERAPRVKDAVLHRAESSEGGLFDAFEDPVDRGSTPRTAAFWRVELPAASKEAELASGLQWLVIMQHLDAVDPAAR